MTKRRARGGVALVSALAAIAAGACAGGRQVAGPVAFPGAPRAAIRSSAMPAAPANITGMLQSALSLRGTPYRLGGDTPQGFDCSGFVRYVFGLHGVDVPRTVADQFDAGRGVGLDRVRPGDLVFFSTTGRGATHVGIVLGDRSQPEFVHAPSDGAAVRVERYDAAYWRRRFVGARRMFQDP